MNLKERLVRRELTIGSWITIGSAIVAEVMARAGYDWLTIDMEHSAITLDVAQDLIRVIELCGVSPLVRVGENSPYLIKRVMDAGAHGVIVPMVNSRQDAEAAVRAIRYPPQGQRGVGLARAQQYGADFEGYRAWNERESILIVQVEHISAVDSIDDILCVPGVDGFIIGPYDLSGSLGVPVHFGHPAVLAALEKVKQASRRLDALAGFHVIPPESKPLADKIAEGFKFIAHSLDTLLLADNCRRLLREGRRGLTPS